MITQLELPEPRQRRDWSQQASRIYAFMQANAGIDVPAPTINRIGAGEGQYIASFSKRISECRSRARREGHDLILSRDEWENGTRKTHYKFIL